MSFEFSYEVGYRGWVVVRAAIRKEIRNEARKQSLKGQDGVVNVIQRLCIVDDAKRKGTLGIKSYIVSSSYATPIQHRNLRRGRLKQTISIERKHHERHDEKGRLKDIELHSRQVAIMRW
jgi:hypothetical protein